MRQQEHFTSIKLNRYKAFRDYTVSLHRFNTVGRPVTSTSLFKSQYNVSIGFVPILGPVEHDAQLYQKEAARLALLTHKAARNFRNIWYHYPEYFEIFRALIKSSWPGMDIEKPEIEQFRKEPSE